MSPRDRLFALAQFGIKLGLENIATLVGALNRPDQAWKAIHVAGTNGKGSVTAMVERGLRAAGHRTGRYTSPHLSHVEERMAIDGQAIDAATFDAAAADVLTLVDELRATGALQATPTFFEVTTAMAFEIFRRSEVSVAVVEVGLGGRFDATNVITPQVSVITSIALDHERHLGTTIDAIAFEKAGIAKPGTPVVLGEMCETARTVITAIARDQGAPIISATPAEYVAALELQRGVATVSMQTPVRAYGPLPLGLTGRHQVANAVVATRTLEVANELGIHVAAEHISEALTDVEWPARLEWLRVGPNQHVLLDAAHNPAGAEALADYIRTTGLDPLPVVLAVMRDKDVAGMLRSLASVASMFVPTAVASERSFTATELAERIAQCAPHVPLRAATDADDAITVALCHAPRVAVAGSIFLVGPARERLIAAGATVVRHAP